MKVEMKLPTKNEKWFGNEREFKNELSFKNEPTVRNEQLIGNEPYSGNEHGFRNELIRGNEPEMNAGNELEMKRGNEPLNTCRNERRNEHAYLQKHKEKLCKDYYIKQSLAQNSSGIFRVTKANCPNCEQGFTWKYQYYDEKGNKKTISSVDLQKLEQKVKKQGLEWRLL